MGFHEFSTGTPAREPPSFSARFSLFFFPLVQKFLLQFHLAAPAREDCLLLDATTGQPECTLSAAVRIPFFLSMDTRGEFETYKKDGTDKDYTTNT
ncbi:hypothetical protein TNCV_3449151 [Trichonephila clavipes]|nr:hypothetical protein TNCV_3449151 [Trichonephila clavipes]